MPRVRDRCRGAAYCRVREISAVNGKVRLSLPQWQNDYRKADSIPVYPVGDPAKPWYPADRAPRCVGADPSTDIRQCPALMSAWLDRTIWRFSLGVPMDLQDPTLEGAIDRVLAACRSAGVASGLHTANLDALAKWQRRGMQMLTYSTDIDMLISASVGGIASLRAGRRGGPGRPPRSSDAASPQGQPNNAERRSRPCVLSIP